MRVLFLDVDGVLNSSTDKPAALVPSHGNMLNRVCRKKLSILHQLVRDTDCKIVLSSTWRKDQEQVLFLKNACGLNIHACTPVLDVERGYEIKAWLDICEEPVRQWAIVDDDGDMLDSQLRRFVQTTYTYGLTKDLAYRLKYILNFGVRHLPDVRVEQPKEN